VAAEAPKQIKDSAIRGEEVGHFPSATSDRSVFGTSSPVTCGDRGWLRRSGGKLADRARLTLYVPDVDYPKGSASGGGTRQHGKSAPDRYYNKLSLFS